jgi:hypothetical protein
MQITDHMSLELKGKAKDFFRLF